MKSIPLKRLGVLALALAGCGASMTQADATLTYELSGSDAEKTVKQFSIARFFVRIDDPAESERYLLFQAGKFFPMYSVDQAEGTYTRLTPAVTAWSGPVSRAKQALDAKKILVAGNDEDHDESETRGESKESEESKPAASEETAGNEQQMASPEPATQPGRDVAESGAPRTEPASNKVSPAPSVVTGERSPAPILKPSNKTRTIAGIRCRVVRELLDGEPVIEHCMANSARLGVTNRELITLSRLFAKSRSMTFGWLGLGSPDEEFVSVQSRDLRDNRVLQLTSVSTKPLPVGYLRISRTFKLVESDTQSDSGPTTKALE